MFRLQRIFKNYAETGSFNELVNLYGFVGSHVFLTKTGDLGVVLEVRGVDYECLDGNTLDGLTRPPPVSSAASWEASCHER
jgi:hypothetical protein